MVYESETDVGSAGSPILKEYYGKLLIVGIHKAGDKESELFNMGVLFSEILRDLNEEELNPSKEIMYHANPTAIYLLMIIFFLIFQQRTGIAIAIAI